MKARHTYFSRFRKRFKSSTRFSTAMVDVVAITNIENDAELTKRLQNFCPWIAPKAADGRTKRRHAAMNIMGDVVFIGRMLFFFSTWTAAEKKTRRIGTCKKTPAPDEEALKSREKSRIEKRKKFIPRVAKSWSARKYYRYICLNARRNNVLLTLTALFARRSS